MAQKQQSKPSAVIWWVRQDLRLADNPALTACVESGLAVLPVYIWDTATGEGNYSQPGGAAKVWLNGSLKALSESLEKLGSGLVLKQGKTLDCFKDLANGFEIQAIFSNQVYEPWARKWDAELAGMLKSLTEWQVLPGGRFLFEPNDLQTGSGSPYQMFTPFYRKCLSQWPETEPLAAPHKLISPDSWPKSDSLDKFGLLPTIKWDQGIHTQWETGEAAAQRRLQTFAKSACQHYDKARDIPSEEGTSRLSPHLHHGEITPRQIAVTLQKLPRSSAEPFMREIVWREFANHILWHFPHTVTQPLKSKFKDFQWRDTKQKQNQEILGRWQQGQTGYPLIDAGMRQLWETGWMHNRVRLAVGSFLVKDLLCHWQAGADWFWDTLVDADLANNTMNWQWVGGCGADAQPFFRIFNPTNQGKKFDAQGHYIRRWVPELKRLPDKYIHQPWNAPETVLQDCKIVLGKTYPEPIVDHDEARLKALAYYKGLT